MVDAVTDEWQPEDIPPAARLFMRVHKNWFDNGEINPGVFRNVGEGMSTDWEKYSDAERTRQRAKKTPEENAVIALVVGEVRGVPGQTVVHTPLKPDGTKEGKEREGNRAHTDVVGEKKKDPEVRKALKRMCVLVLRYAYDG